MFSLARPLMRGICAKDLLTKPNKGGTFKSLYMASNTTSGLFSNKPQTIAKLDHGNQVRPVVNVRDMNYRNFMLTARNFESPKDCINVPKMTPGLAKIRKLQKHYQKDDGKPIFLKGGKFDELLYRFTWAMCFAGLVMDIDLFLYYIID